MVFRWSKVQNKSLDQDFLPKYSNKSKAKVLHVHIYIYICDSMCERIMKRINETLLNIRRAPGYQETRQHFVSGQRGHAPPGDFIGKLPSGIVHRKTIGKGWENGGFMGFDGIICY